MAPGRDESIQKNIDNARRTPVPTPEQAAAPTPQPGKEKEKGSDQPSQNKVSKSDHISLFGSNYALLKTLEAISFQSGGEMYNSIAYIRYWKRSENADTVQGSSPVVENGLSYKCLPSNLNFLKDAGFDSIQFTQRLNEWKGDYTNRGPLDAPTFTEAFNSNLQLPNTFIGQTPLVYNTKIDPTTFASASFPVDPKLAPAEAAQNNPYTICPPVNGGVKSANPNGGFNGFIRRFLGLGLQHNVTYGGLTTSTDLANGGTVGTIPDSSPPVEFPGVWQFLFNPEEIDWEGGPEYGEAEAWAVTGEDNAGRPLFWKYMKNQRLTFSKVVLNGYVFGKRVENLEKGLIDLFMKEDGENTFGPPVLEFLWGNKIFGPCVIKDVRIKEKNWDNGFLVNAELSFTLEKIPKWVVNDGYVDVARPGRQPFQGETFSTPATPPPAGGGENTPPGGAGGGDQPRQQTQTNGYTSDQLKKCAYLLGVLRDQIWFYKYDIKRPQALNNTFINGTLDPVSRYQYINSVIDDYKRYFNYVVNYKTKYYIFWDNFLSYNDQAPWRQQLSSSISTKCKKGNAQFNFAHGEELRDSISYNLFNYNDVINNLKRLELIANNYFQTPDACVSEVLSKVKSSYDSSKCKEINNATNAPTS